MDKFIEEFLHQIYGTEIYQDFHRRLSQRDHKPHEYYIVCDEIIHQIKKEYKI